MFILLYKTGITTSVTEGIKTERREVRKRKITVPIENDKFILI